jgi:hypothetical protein
MDADRPIAVMQDVKSIGGAMVDPIRRLMCLDDAEFAVSRHTELAVTVLLRRGRPIPTPFVWGISGHKPSEYLSLGESLRPTKPLTTERVAILHEPLVVPSTEPSAESLAGVAIVDIAHEPIIRGDDYVRP